MIGCCHGLSGFLAQRVRMLDRLAAALFCFRQLETQTRSVRLSLGGALPQGGELTFNDRPLPLQGLESLGTGLKLLLQLSDAGSLLVQLPSNDLFRFRSPHQLAPNAGMLGGGGIVVLGRGSLLLGGLGRTALHVSPFFGCAKAA